MVGGVVFFFYFEFLITSLYSSSQLFFNPSSIDVREKEKKETATKAGKSAKPTVSATQRATLEMFLDGVSMMDIAANRRLALTTIETHLAGFVGTGELDIDKVVPRHKLDVLLKTIKRSGQTYALKPVKDLLSDEYSYGEIRMAMEYYKKLNS